jgi:hypothetical protein
MTETTQNIITIITSGLILVAGIFILRTILKFAWRIIRIGLIIITMLLAGGYFLGWFNISLP